MKINPYKMKTFLLYVLVLSGITVLGQSNSYKVPKDWSKTFIISIEHTSSQHGEVSRLKFTHDSCTYKTNKWQGINHDRAFALSEQDRKAILSKLRELKIESIQEKNTTAILQGGWSNVLCIGDRCIDVGTVSEMSDKDKEIHLAASRYLQEFARKKE